MDKENLLKICNAVYEEGVDVGQEDADYGLFHKSMDECFKEYLSNLTYDFDALHLNKKQKAKLKKAIERHLEFMEAMDKLGKGIIDEEDKRDCQF